jgi:hypothetical protein
MLLLIEDGLGVDVGGVGLLRLLFEEYVGGVGLLRLFV